MKRLITLGVFALTASLWAKDAVDKLEKNNWKTWNSAKSKVQYKHLPGQGIDKSGALGVVLLPDNPEKGSGMFLRNFPVDSGCYYRVKVSARALKDAPGCFAGLALQAIDNNGKFCGVIKSVSVPATTQWQEISLLGNMPEKGAQLRVLIAGEKGKNNTVIFDNVKVEKFDAAKRQTDYFDNASWDSWTAARKTVKFFHTTSDGRSKKGAAGIKLMPVNNKKASGSILARCVVKPGENYVMLVYAKSSGLPEDGSVGVAIQGLDSKNKFLGTPVRSTKITAGQCEDEWTRILLMFTIPNKGKWAKCDKILITLSGTSNKPGTVLFDDFMLFNAKEESEQ